MQKGTFANDTFEQLLELGQSTAKQTVQGVAKAFNPLASLESTSEKSTEDNKQTKENAQHKKDGSTPLDFDKLNNSYGDQDKQKEAALRRRLFDLVKNDEEKTFMEGKKNKEEKEREEAQEEQEKKRKAHEAQMQQQQGGEPQGKAKAKLGQARKKASTGFEKHAETKAGSSKQ